MKQKMSLEEFLDPNLDEVGLQRNAKQYALAHPELMELYRQDPTGFSYRFKRVIDNVAHKYLHLIAEFNPTLSQKLADKAIHSPVGERIGGKLEDRVNSRLSKKGFKIPKGGIYGVLAGIPMAFSHYGDIKKRTGDSIAAGYMAFGDIIKSAIPFGDSLVDELSQSTQKLVGTTPLQKHIEYKMRDELRKEFKLSPINARQNAANLNYNPSKQVKIRTIGK